MPPPPSIAALAWAEYDFARIDADLATLQARLRRAERDLPACRTAVKRLRLARCLLRHTLLALDRAVTAALRR